MMASVCSVSRKSCPDRSMQNGLLGISQSGNSCEAVDVCYKDPEIRSGFSGVDSQQKWSGNAASRTLILATGCRERTAKQVSIHEQDRPEFIRQGQRSILPICRG